MAKYTLHKTTTAPSSYGPHEIYLVTDPDDPNWASVYISDAAGTAIRATPSRATILALINGAQGATSSVVADIPARDALSPAAGDTVWVTDASLDATVTSGAAQYVYDGGVWQKISEAESLDVVTNWSDIQGRPSSSASAIDAAVGNAHTHANKTEIDKIGEDSGHPTYDGTDFVMSGATNW